MIENATMGKRAYLLGGFLAIVVGVFFALGEQKTVQYEPPVQGRNNTVLFLTTADSGLSNVHLATSFALAEHHPEIEVHYASMPKQSKKVRAVSEAALKRSPNARPIQFHDVLGPTLSQSLEDNYGNQLVMDQLTSPPGSAEIVRIMERTLAPWSASDHYEMLLAIQDIIAEVDPALVVLDYLFVPAVDAARNMNRLHAIISPNPIVGIFPAPGLQPLWKYPASCSGFPFPVPWHLIPKNIFMALRMAATVLSAPAVAAKRDFLIAKGFPDPMNNVLKAYRPDVPWIAADFEGMALPMERLPENVTGVGPIVLSTTTVAEHDPDLAEWLAQRPTLLVNLGTVFKYHESYARVMAVALSHVLESTDLQVLWKFVKAEDYSDDFLQPIQKYIAAGLVVMHTWLSVDPGALLESGHIVAYVNHAGAGAYMDSIA